MSPINAVGPEVRHWDLAAHFQENFHAYGDDVAPVLDAMSLWVDAEGLNTALVATSTRVCYDELDGPFIEGVVEYTGERVVSVRGMQWDCWKVAEDHGWHDDLGPHTLVEKLALIHSEISEALEEHRSGHAPDEIYRGDNGKPEGVPIELADAVIRIFDLAEIVGIDMEKAIQAKQAYNRTRTYRHGGKAC